MKQLGIFDSAYINMEHPDTPQHVGGLGIYDPATAPGGKVRFTGIISNFEKRLQKHTIFRSRLLRVPGDLDHPYWSLDPNFDIEFHLRHVALPKPGDWRQLCILIARLHAQPLDMAKPLWVSYIIEGLDNIPGLPKGAFAVYTKMHHALVEGAGSNSIMAVIHDLEPNPESVTPAPRRARQVPPSSSSLVMRALTNSLSNSAKLWKGSFDLLKGLGKTALELQQKELNLPPLSAPRTRFNSRVGPNRSMVTADIPLDEVNKLARIYSVEADDVLLALVSGALRHYLTVHEELPDESLTALVPASSAGRRFRSQGGRGGMALMALHTEIGDPAERLAEIHESHLEARHFATSSPLSEARYLPGILPPVFGRPISQGYVRRLSNRFSMGVATYVSHVTGPQFPLFCAGASLTRFYGLGSLTPGIGLNHLIYTAQGKASVTVLANRDAMPDPELYQACLDKSFKELMSLLTKPVLTGESARRRKAAAASVVRSNSGDAAVDQASTADASVANVVAMHK